MARQARLALQAPTSATGVPRDARLYPPAGRATRGCDSGSGTLSSTTADPGRRRSSCGRGSPGGRPEGGWGRVFVGVGWRGGGRPEGVWRKRPSGVSALEEGSAPRRTRVSVIGSFSSHQLPLMLVSLSQPLSGVFITTADSVMI